MRYEFHWDVPTPTGPVDLRLQISSISGWLGPKTLTLNGNPIYRRGIFAGINQRLDIPGANRKGHYALKAARTGPDNEWRPTLYAGNDIIPEKLGTKPPHNPRRTTSLAATVGVTYLLIFILFIMWFPIENMLDAANSQTDSRVFILVVEDNAPMPPFRQTGEKLPEATLGITYRAQLGAVGGKPPLTWRRKSGRIPPGLTLDANTGAIAGTPTEPGDYPLTIRTIDSTGADTKYAYVIRVASSAERTPTITTDRLPNATVGEPYCTTLTATGGKPPYVWICNSRKLPNGLKLKEVDPSDQSDPAAEDAGKEWQIVGTPIPQPQSDPNEAPESIAGPYSIQMRVNDDAYHARNDTEPWFLPIGVTLVCLLGFWSMYRLAVIAFAALIALELILHFSGALPVSMTAVAFQTIILYVGLANIRHMR